MEERYDNIEYDFDFSNYSEPSYNPESIKKEKQKSDSKEKTKGNSISHIQKMRDGQYLLTVIQIAVCAVLAVTAYFFKMSDSELYYKLREMYFDSINLSLISTQEDERPLSQRFEASTAAYSSEKSAVDCIEADNTVKADIYERMNNMRKNIQTAVVKNEKTLPTYKIVNDSVKLSEYLLAPLESGVFTSYFGGRPDPTTGVWCEHYGVDIGADEGENIYAAMAGRVVVAEESPSYGNYVVIDHGNDIKTLYAHCSKLYVKKGEYMQKGDIIAAVGSTGDSTGNHLHFEIIIKGVKYDPYDLIKQYYV